MTIQKTFNVETKAIDKEQGIYEAFVSTEDPDRDGDVILADGVDVGAYMKNPVIPFGHNYYDPEAVVAKTLQAEKIPGRGVKLVFQFVKRGISKSADLVHDLWANGFLNAMSIGFIPKTSQPRTDNNGERLARGYLFTSVEMLEGSIVTVPSNAAALRASYGGKELDNLLSKRGRVLSAKNESLLRTALENLQTVLSALEDAPEEPVQESTPDPEQKTETPVSDALSNPNPVEPSPDASLHDESETVRKFGEALLTLMETWSK